MLTWVLERVECGPELRQAKGSQDADDVGVVGKVKVERLVQGKCAGVVVEGDVDLGA